MCRGNGEHVPRHWMVLVVMFFPSPLSPGRAGTAGTNGALGKSPSPLSSCPLGRDGADPGPRGLGGCPYSEHPHPHLLSFPGSPGKSRDEGRDRLSRQTCKTHSRFVCSLGHRLIVCVPPLCLHILNPPNLKPCHVPAVPRSGVMLGCHLGAGGGTGMRLICAAHPQGRPGMNGLKGEKGDPADVSSVLGLRVSALRTPPQAARPADGDTH